MSDYLAASASQTIKFEGSVPWMYLDTRGNVTTAVGHMLASAEEAMSFDFVCLDESLATHAMIKACFERVHAMNPGLPAAAYRWHGALELPSNAIDSLLSIDLAGHESLLRESFSGYEDFPDEAKLALLDMDFNLGHAKLMREFNGFFCPAVARKDWVTAAAHCHRIGPSQQRNDWTKQMFLKAAQEA